MDHQRNGRYPKFDGNPRRGKCRKAKAAGAINHFLKVYKIAGALWEHCQYCDKAWRVNPGVGIQYVGPEERKLVTS